MKGIIKMAKVNLFEDEEQQYINRLIAGRNREKLTRKDILANISFAREIANATDADILALIDGVYSKINVLSDKEWDELKLLFPFQVNISAEDINAYLEE